MTRGSVCLLGLPPVPSLSKAPSLLPEYIIRIVFYLLSYKYREYEFHIGACQDQEALKKRVQGLGTGGASPPPT
jgi:hypothetical protein